MKKFFNKLRGKSDPPPSPLSHPRQLSVGDLMKLDDSFALPIELRDVMFEVLEVNTSQFEHAHEPEWILKGDSGQPIFFSIEEEDGESCAAFSIKVDRGDVESLFDMEQFSSIFEDGLPTRLHANSIDGSLSSWVTGTYEQSGQSERGFFYKKDYRGSQPPETEGSGEPFDYYCLCSEDDDYAVEIEVWGNGETDILLTIYRPLSDIRELWPAKK